MAWSPEAIGTIIGTILASSGLSIGGVKAIDKWVPKAPEAPAPKGFCAEHYQRFEEVKNEITKRVDELRDDIKELRVDQKEVGENVSYIRGVIDRGLK